MKRFIILLALLSLCLSATADETNLIYVTYNSGYFKEQAQIKQEGLPAKDFPEGNWGEAQGGFQLSLRFDGEAFTNGEPIGAILLLRNVTNKIVDYAGVSVGYSDGPIGFEVTDRNGLEIPQHKYRPMNLTGSTFSEGVEPGVQVKFLERLDKRFNLTNGVYSVQAVVRVGDLVGKHEYKPIMNGNGKWTPIVNSQGFVTNLIVTSRPPNPADIYTVKSAKVKIEIEDSR
jgi:hypothetical protein